MNNSDTISAIATPSGDGGIGIIRISGPQAHAVGEEVFSCEKRGGKPHAERSLLYGRVIDPVDGSVIDNGFIVFMKGPRTYTGEDVTELQLHGGALVLKRVLGVVLRSGARAAEPGEFTKRAFLAGRIDLTRAEAVMDIITAGTDEGLASARNRLEGAIYEKACDLRERLLTLISRLEAVLDFSDNITGEVAGSPALGELQGIRQIVTRLLATYREGAALRDGVRVLILGRPNVGKSSLLNRLLGEKRAIVTHLPGTTRDVIEEAINISGIVIRLMDTAGLRETPDFVESLGVEEARKRIAHAGVILFILDASASEFKEDKKLLEGIEEKEDKKILIVANKSDVMDKTREAFIRREFSFGKETLSPVFISATEGRNIGALEAALYELITGHAPGKAFGRGSGEFIATLRQSEAMEKTLSGLVKAEEGLAENNPPDLIAADLKEALRGVEELTGEVTTEEILDRVFSEFCVGK
ncbi:MAG: tRNA uridine-5-carboxymethylaminomethyl(34) synthesis GTPase MnmE [Thermodesulfobacteriota bacterium]